MQPDLLEQPDEYNCASTAWFVAVEGENGLHALALPQILTLDAAVYNVKTGTLQLPGSIWSVLIVLSSRLGRLLTGVDLPQLLNSSSCQGLAAVMCIPRAKCICRGLWAVTNRR